MNPKRKWFGEQTEGNHTDSSTLSDAKAGDDIYHYANEQCPTDRFLKNANSLYATPQT